MQRLEANPHGLKNLSQEFKKAQVSARFIENLIRGICHDLGAPARHVVQFSQLFQESASHDLNEKQQRWLNFVVEGGRQIQDMLSELSQLGKLISNSDSYEEVSTKALFDEVIALYERLAITQRRKLNVVCTGDWPTVSMNKEHLLTLFNNLVENAYLFQEKQSDHTIQLEAHCAVEGQDLLFSLDDNGLGVTDAQISEMCRPFKRLNSAEEYPGYGMGLAYCELIAELNDGKLTIDHSTALGGLKVSYCQPIDTSGKKILQRETT